jgi:hypothetical protein
LGHSIRELFASRSRRIIVATAVIIAMLCAGVYGYLTSLPPPAGPSVTLTSPPLELSMTLDKTQYSFSENMTISFHLRNISNETVTLMRPDMHEAPLGGVITAAEGVTTYPPLNLLNGLYHFGIILYSGNGTVILRDVVGPLKATYNIILQPNASLNQTEFANFASTMDENGRITQRPPGPYGISGVLRATPFELDTPSITFTLG